MFPTAINTVPAKTTAAVLATPNRTGLLLVVVVIVLFDEVLYHTVLLKMWLLVHDLLRRCCGIPQNVRELEIKKPLQPRLRYQLH